MCSAGLLGWCGPSVAGAALQGCSAGTVTEQDPQIAPPREKLTARAGRWATRQAGRARPVDEVAKDLQDPGLAPKLNRLGRTIWRWRAQIANWHTVKVTNAATEAANNLLKRVKRAAFGFTNIANFRIRALLYAGKPDWALLDTLTPT